MYTNKQPVAMNASNADEVRAIRLVFDIVIECCEENSRFEG